MNKIVLCVTVGVLTAFSALARQSVSKVSAKVNSESLSVSYTLAENWDRNSEEVCSETCYYAYVLLFEDKNEAASFFKDGSANPVWEEGLDDDYLGKGKHKIDLDFDGRDLWQDYPNAVAAVCVVDDCGGPFFEGRAAVDFSDVSGASEEALRLYKKAQTLTACVVDIGKGHCCGTMSVKLGAINPKNGLIKVSATYTPFFGKKLTASQTVVADEYGNLNGKLTFKGFNSSVNFEVVSYDDGLYFEANSGEYRMVSESYGGSIDKASLTFDMSMDLDSPSDDSDWVDAWPSWAKITVTNGTKWSLPKASTVKYKKVKEDGETWYELTGLDDGDNSNPCGLKLTYTAKTGVFKGSFTIYSSNECCIDEGKTPSLKKYTGTISGMMTTEGYGCGMASIKVGKTTYTGTVWIE